MAYLAIIRKIRPETCFVGNLYREIKFKCVRACVPACVRACLRACVRASGRACERACMRASVPACVRACLHACVCSGLLAFTLSAPHPALLSTVHLHWHCLHVWGASFT